MNIRPEQSSLYTKYTKASSSLTKKDLFPKNKIKESDFLKHIDFSKVNSGAGLYNELKKQHTFPLELLKSIVYEKATQSSGVKNTEMIKFIYSCTSELTSIIALDSKINVDLSNDLISFRRNCVLEMTAFYLKNCNPEQEVRNITELIQDVNKALGFNNSQWKNSMDQLKEHGLSENEIDNAISNHQLSAINTHNVWQDTTIDNLEVGKIQRLNQKSEGESKHFFSYAQNLNDLLNISSTKLGSLKFRQEKIEEDSISDLNSQTSTEGSDIPIHELDYQRNIYSDEEKGVLKSMKEALQETSSEKKIHAFSKISLAYNTSEETVLSDSDEESKATTIEDPNTFDKSLSQIRVCDLMVGPEGLSSAEISEMKSFLHVDGLENSTIENLVEFADELEFYKQNVVVSISTVFKTDQILFSDFKKSQSKAPDIDIQLKAFADSLFESIENEAIINALVEDFFKDNQQLAEKKENVLHYLKTKPYINETKKSFKMPGRKGAIKKEVVKKEKTFVDELKERNKTNIKTPQESILHLLTLEPSTLVYEIKSLDNLPLIATELNHQLESHFVAGNKQQLESLRDLCLQQIELEKSPEEKIIGFLNKNVSVDDLEHYFNTVKESVLKEYLDIAEAKLKEIITTDILYTADSSSQEYIDIVGDKLNDKINPFNRTSMPQSKDDKITNLYTIDHTNLRNLIKDKEKKNQFDLLSSIKNSVVNKQIKIVYDKHNTNLKSLKENRNSRFMIDFLKTDFSKIQAETKEEKIIQAYNQFVQEKMSNPSLSKVQVRQLSSILSPQFFFTKINSFFEIFKKIDREVYKKNSSIITDEDQLQILQSIKGFNFTHLNNAKEQLIRTHENQVEQVEEPQEKDPKHSISTSISHVSTFQNLLNESLIEPRSEKKGQSGTQDTKRDKQASVIRATTAFKTLQKSLSVSNQRLMINFDQVNKSDHLTFLTGLSDILSIALTEENKDQYIELSDTQKITFQAFKEMINSDIKSYIENASMKLESQLTTFKNKKDYNNLYFLGDDCDEYITLIEKVIDTVDDQSTLDIADLTQLKSDFQSKNQEIKEAKNQVELFKQIEKSAVALTTSVEEKNDENDVNNLLKNLNKFINISSLQPAFERALNASSMYKGISQLNEDEQNKIVLDDRVLSCVIDLKESASTKSITDLCKKIDLRFLESLSIKEYGDLQNIVTQIRNDFMKFSTLTEEFKSDFKKQYPDQFQTLTSYEFLFKHKDFSNYIKLTSQFFNLIRQENWEFKLEKHLNNIAKKKKVTTSKDDLIQKVDRLREKKALELMAEADAESALINGIQSEQKRTQSEEKKQSGIFAELLKTKAKKTEVTKEVEKENKSPNPFAGLGSALLKQKNKLKKTGED